MRNIALQGLRRWGPALAAASLAVGLALGLAPELARAPDTTLACLWAHPDCLGNHWLLVWVAEGLVQGRSLLHNDSYFLPFGDAPWLAGNGSAGFVYLPFHLAWGWPRGAAFYVLVVLVGNTLGGWCLGRAAGAGRWGALVTATVCGSSIYALEELSAGRFSQGDLGWFWAALAGWLALLRRPGWGSATLASLATAGAAVLYWYHGWFLLLAVGVVTLAQWIGRGALPWAWLMGAGASSLGLVLPVLLPFLRGWGAVVGTGEGFRPELMDSLQFGARALHRGGTLPVPAVVLAVAAVVFALRAGGRSAASGVGAVGGPAADGHPAPASLEPPPRGGAVRGGGEAHAVVAFVVVAVLFTWLALGPDAGLFAWVHGSVPPLQRFWWPYRYVVGLVAAVAVLSGLAVRDRPLAATLLALAMPISLSLQGAPLFVHQTRVDWPPAPWEALGELPGEAVWVLPFTGSLQGTEAPLLHQLAHGKRLVNGHAPWVDRVRPDGWDAWVAANPVLAGFAASEAGRGGRVTVAPSAVEDLLGHGVAWVVVDRSALPRGLEGLVEGWETALTALFGPGQELGGGVVAWEVARLAHVEVVDLPSVEVPRGVRRGGSNRPLRPTPELTGLQALQPPRPWLSTR